MVQDPPTAASQPTDGLTAGDAERASATAVNGAHRAAPAGEALAGSRTDAAGANTGSSELATNTARLTTGPLAMSPDASSPGAAGKATVAAAEAIYLCAPRLLDQTLIVP